jgi:phage gp29-like protein
MSVLARITSALGFSAKRDRLASGARGKVIQDLPLWSQIGRIGGALTPRQVSEIIRQADMGNMAWLMDLANESRQKDCHLQSVCSTSEESIAGLAWQIVPPSDALAKEKKAAKWVEESLRSTPSFTRLIAHLAGGVYYGRAVGETNWAKIDGKLAPLEFDALAPRRFSFRQGDGRLVWRDDGMAYEGVDFRTLYPHKFVVSQPRVTGDVPQHEGLCRVLIWAALFRNWTITDWLRTGEISWKPWRIGTYEKNASPEDKSGLETVLRQLTTDGAGMIPGTTKIAIEWPQGTTSSKATHAELANVLAQEMSKAALGQTETVQSSSGSGYAQAKVMDGVRKDLRESRARQVGHDLTRDVVASMITLNFDGVRSPRLEFITRDAVDLASFGKAIFDMATAGVVIPQKWARDEVGIPEPKDGEPTFGGTPEIPITEMPPVDANGKPIPPATPPALPVAA